MALSSRWNKPLCDRYSTAQSYSSFLLAQVTLDPSGLYAATSSSDKTISLFDFYSGECLAKLYGHSGRWGLLLINYFTIRNAHHHSYVLLSSEVVTQLQFSRDCKYLYSVAGDRLVWPVWLVLPDRTHISLASYPGCSSNFFFWQPAWAQYQSLLPQNTITSMLFYSISLQLYFYMAALQSTDTGVCYRLQLSCLIQQPVKMAGVWMTR